jgi:hypothetical protein
VDVSVSIPVSRKEGISAAQIRNRLDWPELVPLLVLYFASSSSFGSGIKFCLRFSVSAPRSKLGVWARSVHFRSDFPLAVFGFIVLTVGHRSDPVALLHSRFSRVLELSTSSFVCASARCFVRSC